LEINEYKQWIESFTFESIIDRTKKRKGKTQEYFTPTELVQEMLDKMELSKPDLFTDENKTLIDNAAGDGQFLTQIVIRKMERSGCSLEKALSTTYGVELMDILNTNIVCHDALTYDYSFGQQSVVDKYFE
jgi:type I restriction-modification system DNA methylase subunit